MPRDCSTDSAPEPGTLSWLERTAHRVIDRVSATPKPQLDEVALIERVLAGERDLFYQLIRPYERALFVSAFSILRHEAEAEDAAQDAVLKAFVNLAQFRKEASFKTWLVQIVINEALARRRKAGRRGEESLDGSVEESGEDYIPRDVADWREIPSEALARRELREALHQAMLRLDEKYRAVLLLRDIQGFSIEETSKMLGVSVANVKVRLLRARMQMRDELAPGFDGAWTTGEPYRKVRSW
jgi:RNA polymerase sigma-70 factor (ECF subfamily)